jgi:hypothetical protein
VTSAELELILAGVLAGEQGETLPQRLCAACVRALPVTGAGLTLMSARGPERVVAATDELAATMEDLQFTLGEGPCMEAARLNRPVLQPDLSRTGPVRWTGFGAAAVEAGIGAIFAFPLQAGGIRLGVLDLYRDAPGILDSDDLQRALVFADAATAVLLHLQRQTPAGGGLHPDLAGPISRSVVVHQATGMIAVQASVGLAEALLMLRARAFSTDRSVLDVARAVVTRTLHLSPEEDHHE